MDFLNALILLLNLCGFIYMGDSGAYLLSSFTGIYLINFSYNNEYISPFLIVVLLWYPCFELLFSMIRRFIDKSETNLFSSEENIMSPKSLSFCSGLGRFEFEQEYKKNKTRKKIKRICCFLQ